MSEQPKRVKGEVVYRLSAVKLKIETTPGTLRYNEAADKAAWALRNLRKRAAIESGRVLDDPDALDVTSRRID